MALYVCLFFHCKSLYLHNNYYWDAIFFILRVEVIKVILILIFFPSFVNAKYFVHYPFYNFCQNPILKTAKFNFLFPHFSQSTYYMEGDTGHPVFQTQFGMYELSQFHCS